MRLLFVLASIIVGLSLSGCAATLANKPVRTIEMPTLKADAVRPKIFLDVHGYNEYRGGRLPEQDVTFKRAVQKHFKNYSEQHNLFSRIETDPWFADQCDYRVELLMFAGTFRPKFLAFMAYGISYGIVPVVGDNNYSAMVLVTDKSGAEVLSASEKQTEREVYGLAALPLMLNEKASSNWQYESAEEYLTVRVIRELMNSTMFAPKPAIVKPVEEAKVKVPAKLVKQKAKNPTSSSNKATEAQPKTDSSPVNSTGGSGAPTANMPDKKQSAPAAEKPKNSAFDPAAIQKIIEENNKLLNKPAPASSGSQQQEQPSP